MYSDADAGARHVREADTAVRLGPADPRSSYLDAEAVLAACLASGAQAVHPGYGFLSENASFARLLAENGIAFIGPGIKALELMGDKIQSKNHVAGYGVPVIPGIAEPGLGDGELTAAAAGVGYPLLIKPSAGGGGKGMHAVSDPAELPAALASARRVAARHSGTTPCSWSGWSLRRGTLKCRSWPTPMGTSSTWVNVNAPCSAGTRR